jgi:hypothetical protein
MAVPNQRNNWFLGLGSQNKFGRGRRSGGLVAVAQTVNNRQKNPAGKTLDDMPIP